MVRLAAAATLVIAALTVAAVVTWPADAQVTRTSSDSDAIHIVNGRDGQPILAIRGMVPGHSVAAEITLSNDGVLPASLVLTPTRVTDTPGPNGGRLSDVLRVRIEDVTDASAQVAYDGAFREGQVVDVRDIPPRGSRTFRFTVTMPDGGMPPSATTGDNAFQESAMQVDYAWSSAPRTAAPSKGPVAAGRCASRRNFLIRLREPRHDRLRSARVEVNGRPAKVRRRHGRLTARVDLRSVRSAKVRVRIVARTRAGHRLTGTRTYSTCSRRLVGKRRSRL